MRATASFNIDVGLMCAAATDRKSVLKELCLQHRPLNLCTLATQSWMHLYITVQLHCLEEALQPLVNPGQMSNTA
jgi:hypothetical protein